MRATCAPLKRRTAARTSTSHSGAARLVADTLVDVEATLRAAADCCRRARLLLRM